METIGLMALDGDHQVPLPAGLLGETPFRLRGFTDSETITPAILTLLLALIGGRFETQPPAPLTPAPLTPAPLTPA